MRLNSARELKEELLNRARENLAASLTEGVAPFLAATPDIDPVGWRQPNWIHPTLALGVGRKGPGKSDYTLAVRVFKGREDLAAPILEQAERLQEEADIARGITYQPRATLRPGVSCGHYAITAGTLGGFVEDDENYYILSNNHVLANSDDAARGDPIYQPGPADIRERFDVIGRLHHWVPLASGMCDAALATFSDIVEYFYPWTYEGIGDTDPTPVEDRYEVSSVTKRGRTTAVTRGRVSAFELDGVAVNYGTFHRPRIVTFDDQAEFIGDPPAGPFSQPGDSGSFIFDAATLRPYALLYAGGSGADGVDRTLAHFLPDVLNPLGVRLIQ